MSDSLLSAPMKLFRRLKALYKQLRLKYAVPFLILLAYTVIGALAFLQLELSHDNDIRSERNETYTRIMNEMRKRIVEIGLDSQLNESTRAAREARIVTDHFEKMLRNSSIQKCINETIGESPWSFFNALLYAGTLYTTIGYGRPAAATTGGQVLTCIYTAIGIPLFLTILKEIGVHMSRGLRKAYKRGYSAWHRATPPCHWQWPSQFMWRRLRSPPPAAETVELGVITTSDGFEDKLARDKQRTPFPISLAVGILCLWMFMSAALLHWWEPWGYWESLYFFFISISTVGLGDIILSESKWMALNFLLILFGLALLSMCVNMVQMYIEALLDDMLQQFMAEFEKISAGVAQRGQKRSTFEIDISTQLASGPLEKLGRADRKTTVDKTRDWFVSHFANRVTGTKRGRPPTRPYDTDSAPSSDDEDKKGAMSTATTSETDDHLKHTMNLLGQRTSGGGFKNRLLAKMMNQQRLQTIEEKIIQKTALVDAAVQTENEFSELIEFLSLPAAARSRLQQETTAATVERASAGGGSLPSYTTAHTDFTYITAYEQLPNDGDKQLTDDRRWSVIGREAAEVADQLKRLTHRWSPPNRSVSTFVSREGSAEAESSMLQSISLSHRSDCDPLLTESMISSAYSARPIEPDSSLPSQQIAQQSSPPLDDLGVGQAALTSTTTDFTGSSSLFPLARALPIATRSSPDDGLEYRCSPITPLPPPSPVDKPTRAHSCEPSDGRTKKRVRFSKTHSLQSSQTPSYNHYVRRDRPLPLKPPAPRFRRSALASRSVGDLLLRVPANRRSPSFNTFSFAPKQTSLAADDKSSDFPKSVSCEPLSLATPVPRSHSYAITEPEDPILQFQQLLCHSHSSFP